VQLRHSSACGTSSKMHSSCYPSERLSVEHPIYDKVGTLHGVLSPNLAPARGIRHRQRASHSHVSRRGINGPRKVSSPRRSALTAGALAERMKRMLSTRSHPLHFSRAGSQSAARLRPRSSAFAPLAVVFAVLLAVMAACDTPSGPASSATSTPARSLTPIPPSPVAGQYPILVYFSKFPVSSETDFGAVFPVNRVSPTRAVQTFSIQLLIAGPTPDERQAGYFSELNSLLTGPSTCSAPFPTGGPDFVLKLSMRAAHLDPAATTLQFCRALSVPGVGAEARVAAEITATLKQFPGITHVVILTVDGHCFGDESGRDLCLA